MTATPCIGNEALYDIVLFDDTPPAQRQQAVHRAAALCATCPAKCDQIVTVDSSPRDLVLLDSGWMPPQREGTPEPEPPVSRRRRTQPITSEYVPPDQRVAVWTSRAVRQAAAGMPLAAIADDLCVTEETAARLLALGQAGCAA